MEAQVGHWTLDSSSGQWRSLQLVVIPLARHTWNRGHVPVFVEGGIGASYFLDQLHTTTKAMPSRWNFHDTLAIGVQFGVLGQHELSLRLVHQSNAGLRKPNAGINSATIRGP